MKPTKKFWITIEPYVYTTFSNYSALLYNTLDGKTIKTDNKIVLELLHELYLKENCGISMISEKQMSNQVLSDFIKELREKFMGDIIDVSLSSGKPIQLVPKLSLLSTAKNSEGKMVDRAFSSYLMDVNIYFMDGNIEMSHSIFDEILNKLSDCTLNSLLFSGNNLWEHSSFKDIVNSVKEKKHNIIFCSDYQKIKEEQYVLSLFISNKFILRILVDFPVNMEKFNSLFKFFKNKMDRFEFIFFVKNVDDYKQVENILTEKDINKYTITPLYTQNNLDFFQQNIYMNEEDIVSVTVSMREIFMHQALNTNDFGKITIMPNGDVFANTHFPSIGNILTDTIQEILYNEMNKGQSWLRIRNQAPCNECIYQWLCPSPSDYELDIGKPNLCHVHP